MRTTHLLTNTYASYVNMYGILTEEKYTWVLSPNDRTEDVGVHYLVVKPIVEPGIKSINATVAVISIAAQCKYWNEIQSSWSEDGCRVGYKIHPSTMVE